jgi:ribonuclease T2
LALSWSPSFCASRGHRDPLQCNSRQRYDFVVHGLWPQYRRGWPQYCDAGVARLPEALPEDLIDSMLDIMPSRDLVRHQWNKHGTCTGLDPRDYFALTRRLHDAIRIPARYIEPALSIEVSVGQIVADFVATNRKLTPAMISVDCGNRRGNARLAELRLCFSRDGQPTACGDNERRQCRARRLVLPPVR